MDKDFNLPLDWGDAVPKTEFFGVSTLKNPLDAWIYQEIIWKRKPDVIIETGSYMGGSALYFAMLCSFMDHGRIITIEKEEGRTTTAHERITFLTGDSSEMGDQVIEMIQPFEKVMVILDSDHTADHVTKELKIYAPLVTAGQYCIVEDTFWNPNEGGPWPAIKAWLPKHPEFKIDETCERFKQTYNMNGFLLRL